MPNDPNKSKSDASVVSHDDDKETDAILKHWTVENANAATPLPLPTLPAPKKVVPSDDTKANTPTPAECPSSDE